MQVLLAFVIHDVSPKKPVSSVWRTAASIGRQIFFDNPRTRKTLRFLPGGVHELYERLGVEAMLLDCSASAEEIIPIAITMAVDFDYSIFEPFSTRHGELGISNQFASA